MLIPMRNRAPKKKIRRWHVNVFTPKLPIWDM